VDYKSVAREINASLENRSLQDARLLRCLAAGWALENDLRLIVPILSAVEATRQHCYRALASRLEEKKSTRLSGAVKEGGFYDALVIWEATLQLEDGTVFSPPTFVLYFNQQCIDACDEQEISAVIGFLLAFEAIAVHIRAALHDGLRKAELPVPPITGRENFEESMVFKEVFLLHTQDFSSDAIWCKAVERALSLFLRLFGRVAGLSDKIQARLSLERSDEPPIPISPGVGEIMCEERDDKRGIQFTVERYPCTAETLDPRVVRIPPGKTNNLHKHAHETLFCFIEGTGRILVGETWVPVKSGDAVFAPRWAMHQTHNTGTSELVLLAITDYYLTSTVYVGKYDKI
jgi:mannose-6-phosphate isomerase-like protein (cupin superfamily)